eukprot:Rhum_TRINITY_DN12906_c0_g1::Rhum_TRINITY_DN12906_c0_g1_i1::g.55674::m.55674
MPGRKQGNRVAKGHQTAQKNTLPRIRRQFEPLRGQYRVTPPVKTMAETTIFVRVRMRRVYSSSSSSAAGSSLAASFALASSSAFCAASAFSNSAFSALFVAPHVASMNVFTSSTESEMMMLSNTVPDFTCQRSKPRAASGFGVRYSSLSSTYSGLGMRLAAHGPLYSGFGICLAFHSPLNLGFLIVGASHSPSSSSSQSSGLAASGSTISSGSLSQSSGFLSEGSAISASSTHVAGFLSVGSSISLGLRKAQSSSRLPPSFFTPSTCTSYVPSGFTIAVYTWVSLSSSHLGSFFHSRFSPL